MAELGDEEVPAEEIDTKDEENTEQPPDPLKKYGELERKLPNRVKYAPKANQKRVFIPFVTPWENTPAKQSQSGMGAFGKSRNPVTKVDQGAKELVQGELNTENILTLFAEHNIYASQSGTGGFGKNRNNVTKFISSKELDPELVREGYGIIPKQAGSNAGPSQAGESPMGAIRRQVPKIQYQFHMSETMDPESETFVGRLMTPNPVSHAGSSVLDRRRNQVNLDQDGLQNKHASDSESIIPMLWDTKELEIPSGTGAGQFGYGKFRQVITKTTGGYGLDPTEMEDSMKEVPWQTAPMLESQQGTGGFHKVRDVVNHVKYNF